MGIFSNISCNFLNDAKAIIHELLVPTLLTVRFHDYNVHKMFKWPSMMKYLSQLFSMHVSISLLHKMFKWPSMAKYLSQLFSMHVFVKF